MHKPHINAMEEDDMAYECVCGGPSDLYVIRTDTGGPELYLTFCSRCLSWTRYAPDSIPEPQQGLPDDIRDMLDQRGEKIRCAPPPSCAPPANSIPLAPTPMAITEGMSEKPEPGMMEQAGPRMMEEKGPGMMEQGVVSECIYCTEVYPELRGRCPLCKGSEPGFRPARMMDGPTSREMIMSDIRDVLEGYWALMDAEPDRGAVINVRRGLIGLASDMHLYNFSALEAVIDLIRRLDMETGMDPGDVDQ